MVINTTIATEDNNVTTSLRNTNDLNIQTLKNKQQQSLRVSDLELYNRLHYIVIAQAKIFSKGALSDFFLDDYIVAGEVGLAKAINKYEPSKGKNINAYATSCVRNQMYMFYTRSEKKHQNLVSLNSPLTEEGDSELVDILSDSTINIEEELCNSTTFCELMNIILNHLNYNESYILLSLCAGKFQIEIAPEFGVLQSYIAKILKKTIDKVITCYNNIKASNIITNTSNPKNFSFSIYNNIYTIKFSDANFEIFKEILSKIIEKYSITKEAIKINLKSKSIEIAKDNQKAIEYFRNIFKEIGLYKMTAITHYLNSLEINKLFKKADILDEFSYINPWCISQVLLILQENEVLGRQKNFYYLNKRLDNPFFKDFITLNCFN